MWQKEMWQKEMWIKNVVISCGWYPQWDLNEIGYFDAHTNGWSWGYPCFDSTLRLGKFSVSLTIFDLPNHKSRGGYYGDE